MRRQFTSTYQQAIGLIKELKNSNDHLNRAVGLQTSSSIAARIKRQQPLIQKNIQRIQSLIQKLEQSYLDPDTARKIGTAKQQFRIQKDRRTQIIQSANYEQSPSPKKDREGNKELASMGGVVESSQSFRSNGSNRTRFSNKESETTNQNSIFEKEQEMEVQFQMERKLMNQRNQDINIVAKSIMNVHNIMQETGVLVHQQGEQLDIIGEEMFTAYRNVTDARQNIAQANDLQQRSRRKYVYLSMLILVLLAVGAIVLFV